MTITTTFVEAPTESVVGSMSTISASANGHVPSFPDIFRVHFQTGEFRSGLFAVRPLKKGEVILQIKDWIPAERTRTSIQIGEKEHIEWNSDMVFANHSCDPNLGVDLSSPDRSQWKVVALKDVDTDEEVTWFYPSTEWDSWGGGFPCGCHATNCVGQYKGAISLTKEQLDQHPYVNPHIYSLAAKRDAA